MYWTDRPQATYCDHTHGVHTLIDSSDSLTDGIFALVKYHRPVIHFLNLKPDDGTDNTDLACMALNLIHETSHTFGTDDTYNIPSHNSEGCQCVMESYPVWDNEAVDFCNQVKDGLVNAFCDACADYLLNEIGYD